MKQLLVLLTIFINYSYGQTAKDIAKKCLPSTVSITMHDKNGQAISLGSGFIIEDGKVVTNLHVIEGAASGYINEYKSTIKHNIAGYFSTDKVNDLVILSIPSLVGISINISSDEIETGEKIYAIGNPSGLSGTISEGIVSGRRTLSNNELIQITAAISPGSSGGPVINDRGEVIGVAVGTLNSGQNLNFAVPIKFVGALKNSTSNLSKLNIQKKAIIKKENVELNINHGVQIVNVEWDKNDPELGLNYDELKGFSIRNMLDSDVKDIKLLLILKNAQGIPIDNLELEVCRFNENIKPKLSKFIDCDYYSFRGKRAAQKKHGEKLEIRVLDFAIVQ